MSRWTHIIIHHSWTGDTELADYVAIKKFHTSWRKGGNIISEEEARKLKEQGVKVTPPWADIGYHFVVEHIKDEPVILFGRPLYMSGAHCVGMNRVSIGICVVGNYDERLPDNNILEKTAYLVGYLMHVYKIPMANVQPHRMYASYKTCPGKRFPMAKLVERATHYYADFRHSG